MKKNKFYYFAFLFCTLTLGLTSCEKEDDDNGGKSSDLIGYWLPVSEEWELYIDGELYDQGSEDYSDEDEGIRFDKDGDFYWWEAEANIETEYGGTYSYKNGKLKIHEEYDDETWIYTVKTLTSQKMVWEMTESGTEEGIQYKAVARITLRKVNVDD